MRRRPPRRPVVRAPATPERERVLRSRAAYYARHRAVVGRKLLYAVLRAEGTMDATAAVNSACDAMQLRDLGLEPQEVMGSVETILQAEVVAILAQHAHLPRAAKADLVERLVARMVPRRDNVPVQPRMRTPDLSRHDDLAREMRREMDDVTRGRK